MGVLHHTPDPVAGIQALARKLSPGGLLHVFVYGELGRWEITMMQEQIVLLQGNRRGDYEDGVAIGRQLFGSLPEDNRLRQREQDRWSWENQRDECFADMYVHPQEIDYNINTVLELIDASELEFVGCSNPYIWNLNRLVGTSPDLLERAATLSDRQRYRLTELLNPSAINHYEFFLACPPLAKQDWLSNESLLSAVAEPSPCLENWQESPQFFNQDYYLVKLEESPWRFLVECGKTQGQKTVGELLHMNREFGHDRES